jgi:hypothetical protein
MKPNAKSPIAWPGRERTANCGPPGGEDSGDFDQRISTLRDCQFLPHSAGFEQALPPGCKRLPVRCSTKGPTDAEKVIGGPMFSSSIGHPADFSTSC